MIVDYIGIFDDVAKALDFDEKSVQKVITNIEEVNNLNSICVEHKSTTLITTREAYMKASDKKVFQELLAEEGEENAPPTAQ